ncbi:unnamed protein product [Diatraea saccharalis]|uniref:Uncharacterized protein n=1 Tax=Diatraea saccharalis TaxID=40085 RepID=A0A9N9WA62_9NEOP|nr:unnamed protein product [Diatraea saccharalis]
MKLDAPSSSATLSLKKNTSFQVALKVAQCKKPHSIAEELIKPAAIAMARTVRGDEIAKKLEMVPISNDTVKKRIDLMSLDILEQLITDLKTAIKFSIQIDESIDIEDFPQFLAYDMQPDLHRVLQDVIKIIHLENEMARYIPQNVHIEKYSWVRNPFEVDVMAVENDTAGLQEELLELQGDRVLKERFATMSLTKFWAELSGKSILINEAEKLCYHFQAVTQNTEMQLRQALQELKDSKDTCNQLLQERDESEEEIKHISGRNSQLKSELGELHTEHIEVMHQRDQLKDALSTLKEELNTHERVLNHMTELEQELNLANNKIEVLFEQQNEHEAEYNQSLFEELVKSPVGQSMRHQLTACDIHSKTQINFNLSTRKYKKYIKIGKVIQKT